MGKLMKIFTHVRVIEELYSASVTECEQIIKHAIRVTFLWGDDASTHSQSNVAKHVVKKQNSL